MTLLRQCKEVSFFLLLPILLIILALNEQRERRILCQRGVGNSVTQWLPETVHSALTAVKTI